MASNFRFICVLSGIALWLAFPFVFWNGTMALFEYHCALEPASENSDPCFHDGIPVIEIVAFPATLALLYPFARFVFSLFAPEPEQRSYLWWLAGRSSSQDYFPGLHCGAAIGIVWALLHASGYPIIFYPYHLYWAAWVVFFGLGMWLGWPKLTAKS